MSMAKAKALSIHHATFFLNSSSMVVFPISFDVTVWLIDLIAVFNFSYI